MIGDNRNAPSWGILIVADEKERLTPNSENSAKNHCNNVRRLASSG
jgi:hypothetical protein